MSHELSQPGEPHWVTKNSKNWAILPLEESITHFTDLEFFELSYHHRGPEESEAAGAVEGTRTIKVQARSSSYIGITTRMYFV